MAPETHAFALGIFLLNYNYSTQCVPEKIKTRMADDQQFCLRWNDFQTNMVASFKHLRDEKSFCDVTIATEVLGEIYVQLKLNLLQKVRTFRKILSCVK